jgi:hypothetical protein
VPHAERLLSIACFLLPATSPSIRSPTRPAHFFPNYPRFCGGHSARLSGGDRCLLGDIERQHVRLWPWCRTTALELCEGSMASAAIQQPLSIPNALRHGFCYRSHTEHHSCQHCATLTGICTDRDEGNRCGRSWSGRTGLSAPYLKLFRRVPWDT